MRVYEIKREDFLKSLLPSINPRPDEEHYLKAFCENPYCHFWVAEERQQVYSLVIGELKYGKLEIFRYFNLSLESESFLSFVNSFIQSSQVSGIVVFQNLRDYFTTLEKIGFIYDADITMVLDIANYKVMDVPILEFEILNDNHRNFIYELKKVCYNNDFYQRLVHKEYLDSYCGELVGQIFKAEIRGFVGRANNEYIGTVIWLDDGEPEIIDIMVKPEMHGRGYGKSLLQKAILNIMERGFTKIRLGVFESNHPAYELYRKAGFVETGRLRTMYWKR